MSKVLRTAALVVGGIALIATGVGAIGALAAGTSLAAGIAAVGTTIGVSVGTLGAIGAGLSLAAGLLAKRPSVSISGNQTKFTASLDQGIPYVVGRTRVSGWVVHRQTFDKPGTKNNAFQTFIAVWSLGRIKSVVEFQVDGKPVTFDGTGAGGGFANHMWLSKQLGATPEALALGVAASGDGAFAGWTTSSKLSGYAAFSWTVKFDKDGKVFPGGAVPTPGAIIEGNFVYDPRQDSSYPGGSGPCRARDEGTYVYSENPALHALTWAIGRWQNGKRVLGIGMALAAIDTPAFVQAANVADANGWKAGGTVFSTDGKLDVLKKMLAAGSAQHLQLGGLLSCSVDAPRVSIATITDDDIIGKCTVPNTPRIRDRLNGIIPTYRSAAHDWQLVPAAKVKVDAYVAEDGRPRTRSMTWELVQDANQVAKLAAYAICNSREFGPAVLPLKLKWIGFKPGDAVTVASSMAGMQSQLVVIQRRNLDPASGAVTLSVRSETTEKHAFALGKTTTPPPTPALQASDVVGQLLQPGISASWSAVDDDDGKRPQDGATVGTPAGYYVHTVLAEDVVTTMAALTQADTEASVAIGRIAAQTRPGAPNLLANGDFRNDLNGWGSSGSGNWAVVASSEIGNYVAQVSGNAEDLLFRDVPISPGVAYSFGFEADPDTPNGVRLQLHWINAAKTQAVGAIAAIYADNWQRVASDPIVAPAGAAYARLHLIRSGASGTPVRATRIQIQQGAATAWNDAADGYEINTRLNVESYIRTGQMSAVVGRASVLEAQVAGTQDSYLKARIDETATAAADATSAAAQVSTKLTAATRSAPNLLKNGDFSNGLSWWNQVGAGWGAATSPVSGPFASHTGTGTSTDYDFVYQDVPFAVGVAYSLTAEGNDFGGGQEQRVFVDWISTNGAYTRALTIDLPDGDFAQRGGGVMAPVPANTGTVRVYVGTQRRGSFAASRVLFQAGAPTAWRDDATQQALQASVTFSQAVLSDVVNNKLQASWQVLVDVGGSGKAGVIVRAQKADGTVTSNVDILCNSFSVWNPTLGSANDPNAYQLALRIEDGEMRYYGTFLARSIKTNHIEVGGVGTDNLFLNAVSTNLSATAPGDVQGNGAVQNVAPMTFTLFLRQTVTIIFAGAHDYTAGQPSTATYAIVDGQSYYGSGSGANTYATGFAFFWRGVLEPGQHTVALGWAGGDSGVRLKAGASGWALTGLKR